MRKAWLAVLGLGCGAASPLAEGPECTALARVQLSPGEFVQRKAIAAGAQISVTAQTERMWRMADLPAGWSGALAPGALLLERDGVWVVRVTQAGRFRGYVANAADGRASLFTSPQFRGTPYDGWFFGRVTFRTAAAPGCGP